MKKSISPIITIEESVNSIDVILKAKHTGGIIIPDKVWVEFFKSRDHNHIYFTTETIPSCGFLCKADGEYKWLVKNNASGIAYVVDQKDAYSNVDEITSFPDINYSPYRFTIKENMFHTINRGEDECKVFSYEDFFDYVWLHNNTSNNIKQYVKGLFNLPENHEWFVYDREDNRYAFFDDDGAEWADIQTLFDKGDCITTVDSYKGYILTFTMGYLVLSIESTREDKLSIKLDDCNRAGDVIQLVKNFMKYKEATDTFLERTECLVNRLNKG